MTATLDALCWHLAPCLHPLPAQLDDHQLVKEKTLDIAQLECITKQDLAQNKTRRLSRPLTGYEDRQTDHCTRPKWGVSDGCLV